MAENTTILTAGARGPYVPGARVEGIGSDLFGNSMFAKGAPDYLEMARKGLIFASRTLEATPVTIKKYDNSDNTPMLWNPSDSQKIIVPLWMTLTPAAVASAAVAAFSIAKVDSAGDVAGAGNTVEAWTNITPVCLRLGDAETAKGKFAHAACELATANIGTSVFLDTGLGDWIEGTAAISGPYPPQVFTFKGAVTMSPGELIAVVGNAVSGNTFYVNMVWAEFPNITLD